MAEMEFSETKSIKVSWTILYILVGLVFVLASWMTSMELRAQDLKEKITTMESIDKRLYRIEIKLGIEEK